MLAAMNVRWLRRGVLVMSLVVVLPALAQASSPPIKNGYYAGLVGVRTVDVEFHVRGHVSIPNLSLTCAPADPSLTTDTSYANIAIVAPALRIQGGRISYHGPAKVTLAYAGAPKIADSTLNISGSHVNGPVHHYTYQGQHLVETTAWKGTASSPACATPPHGDAFTLFGPVPGE